MSRFVALLLLVVGVLQSFVAGTVDPPTFSEEELRVLSTLNLCARYTGQCGDVCPDKYIRHRWGVPLCPLTPVKQECCYFGPEEGRNESATTTRASAQTTSTPTPTEIPEITTCGTMTSAQSDRQKRIVGGQVASRGRWPWLLTLRSLLGSHACSAALISQRWVVTAAHCFKFVSSPGGWRVRIGEYHLLQQDAGERSVRIERIVVHPNYRNNPPNDTVHGKYLHDIALIKLAEPAGKEPICLPEVSNTAAVQERELSNLGQRSEEARPYSDSSCWVAGWGHTKDSHAVDDNLLREVTGDVIDHVRCGQMWGADLENDMLCFGDGTYGPCGGDSGGPLSCQLTTGGPFYLTGVVSWGTETCDVSGLPSVFTHIPPFMPWIRNVTGLQ